MNSFSLVGIFRTHLKYMNITIKRFSKRSQAIDGTLYIDGIRICDTAENAESCLRPGTYPVIRHKCRQKARFVPVILSDNCPDRERLEAYCRRCKRLRYVTCNSSMPCFCPQITMGNGVHNRKDGSIITGTRIVSGCLKQSKEPFENICERLRKLDGRGSEVTLTIR